MTEPVVPKAPAVDAPAPAGAERVILFRDREFWVKLPSPEQLLVWKRTLTMLQGPEVKDWRGTQVMLAVERTRMIIDSVLVNEVDVTWLDVEMLAGRLGLAETAEIVLLAVKAFGEGGNRADQRAATLKKATRRKATPK